jgi:hypothetical protein
VTVAVHCEVCPACTEAGLQEIETEVMVDGAVTFMGAVPDLLVSWVDVAVTVTVPAVVAAVNSPEELIVPALALQVTPELYVPVPVTVAVHCEVCAVCTEPGLQETETEVMVGGAVTFMVAAPDLVVSCVDMAVTVTVPTVEGAVNRPEELIVPALALQVTPELYVPVPVTVAVHCEVCAVCTEAELQETETEVMVGGVVRVVIPPPLPPQLTKTATDTMMVSPRQRLAAKPFSRLIAPPRMKRWRAPGWAHTPVL